MAARVQLGLISMVNDAGITEREKRIRSDEATQLLTNFDKPVDSNLELCTSHRGQSE